MVMNRPFILTPLCPHSFVEISYIEVHKENKKYTGEEECSLFHEILFYFGRKTTRQITDLQKKVVPISRNEYASKENKMRSPRLNLEEKFAQ